MEFDILIVNGTVVDGTGAPRRCADVGIAGGRIAAVGELAGQEAALRIDASGDVVCPGFIDAHQPLGRVHARRSRRGEQGAPGGDYRGHRQLRLLAVPQRRRGAGRPSPRARLDPPRDGRVGLDDAGRVGGPCRVERRQHQHRAARGPPRAQDIGRRGRRPAADSERALGHEAARRGGRRAGRLRDDHGPDLLAVVLLRGRRDSVHIRRDQRLRRRLPRLPRQGVVRLALQGDGGAARGGPSHRHRRPLLAPGDHRFAPPRPRGRADGHFGPGARRGDRRHGGRLPVYRGRHGPVRPDPGLGQRGRRRGSTQAIAPARRARPHPERDGRRMVPGAAVGLAEPGAVARGDGRQPRPRRSVARGGRRSSRRRSGGHAARPDRRGGQPRRRRGPQPHRGRHEGVPGAPAVDDRLRRKGHLPDGRVGRRQAAPKVLRHLPAHPRGGTCATSRSSRWSRLCTR